MNITEIMEYGEMMRKYGETNDITYFQKANVILAKIADKPKKKKVTVIEVLEGQMNLFDEQ